MKYQAGFLVLALALVCGVSGQVPDPECPFTPGSCPVTLDNVADVFFYDVMDQVSCQKQCQTVPDCHFFTMFGVENNPSNHNKCFLFKTCDHLETCPDCITGPELPPIDQTNCTYTGNTTCETSLDNIVDVYYFDFADSLSCHHQCVLLDTCNFWTQFKYEDTPNNHFKCFLYKDCTIEEPCTECETGPKNSPYYQSLYEQFLLEQELKRS